MVKTKRNKKLLRIIGIVLIVAGTLVILYPLYTNFVLKRQEADILASWEDTITETPGGEAETDADPTHTITDQEEEIEVDSEKKVPFKITIPKIDLEWIVNQGTDTATLKKGPGHYTDSALPGEIGKCVVAGHRTTYGAPFNRIDELEPGDIMLIETLGNEEFIYLMTEQEEVVPTDMSVLENIDYPTILLSTCTPKFYATRRLIVYGEIPEELLPEDIKEELENIRDKSGE